MKTLTITDHLDSIRKCEDEIHGLTKRGDENVAVLRHFITEGDLDSQSIVDELCRAQALAALIPLRIQSRVAAITIGEESLLMSCHAAIQDQLSPMIVKLKALARAKVRATLAPHLREEHELARSIESSDLVRRLNGISVFVTHTPMNGVRAYAATIIAALAAAEAIGRELS